MPSLPANRGTAIDIISLLDFTIILPPLLSLTLYPRLVPDSIDLDNNHKFVLHRGR